jgi:hypothetical protein
VTDDRFSGSDHLLMVAAGPRLSPKLLAAIARIDDGSMAIAEINRRVGRRAERLGRPRPSYECVREHVHAVRRRRRVPSTTEVLVDVALRVSPVDAVLDHVSGVGVPTIR